MCVNITLSNYKKKLYVYSDEVIELAVEERAHGNVTDVIKPALNQRIKAARTRDKAWASSIGVFVIFQNAGAHP